MDDEARELQAMQQEMADIMDRVSALRLQLIARGARPEERGILDEWWKETMRAWILVRSRTASDKTNWV